mmetsp:Transcript_60955/g.145257  ORF Transcript_60955/g.145257 Transcript_60955/m.145257 type:complete len:242 (-) Transcript_60955:71-796(-)
MAAEMVGPNSSEGLAESVEPMTVSDTPILPPEAPSSRPRGARVAESGSIGGGQLRPKLNLLRDLLRRRQVEPSFPDPCMSFMELNVSWQKECGAAPTEEDIQALSHPDVNVLDKGGFVWIALMGREAVGCVSLVAQAGVDVATAFNGQSGSKAWQLGHLTVKSDSRRQGLGRTLLRAVLRQYKEVAKAGDVLYMELPTALEGARALCREAGFQEEQCSEALVAEAGRLSPSIRMVFRHQDG